jgi:peptidoglycan/xylan/chitin deacetylase (PgdA/CDA1 family)
VDDIHMTHWYMDKGYSMSFVFDDNLKSQPEIIAPLLEKYGYRGTFAIVTGPVKPTYQEFFSTLKDQYLNLYRKGHELANHGYTHMPLKGSDKNLCVDEFTRSICEFRNFGLKRPVTYIQPGNGTDAFADSVLFSTHLVSRISSVCPMSNRFAVQYISERNIFQFQYQMDVCKNESRWLIFAGHGVDGDGWEPVMSSMLDEVCKRLKGDSDVWVSTMREIGVYERMYYETTIHTELLSDTSIRLKLVSPKLSYYVDSFGLDSINITLKIPLSRNVRFTSPDSCAIFYIQKNGKLYALVNVNAAKVDNIQLNISVPKNATVDAEESPKDTEGFTLYDLSGNRVMKSTTDADLEKARLELKPGYYVLSESKRKGTRKIFVR